MDKVKEKKKVFEGRIMVIFFLKKSSVIHFPFLKLLKFEFDFLISTRRNIFKEKFDNKL